MSGLGQQDDPLTAAVRELVSVARDRALDPASRDQLADAVTRLSGPLRLAIAGRVKAGKSTLLNALVGEELAPTDAGHGEFRRGRRLRSGCIRVSAKRSQSVRPVFCFSGLLLQFRLHLRDPKLFEGGCVFRCTAFLLKLGKFVENAEVGALDGGEVAEQALELFGLLDKDGGQAYC